MHIVMHFFMHVWCVNSIKYEYEYEYYTLRTMHVKLVVAGFPITMMPYRPVNFKVGVQMEVVDPHQRQAPWLGMSGFCDSART